mgnify:CR=1 FL=1
MASSLGFGRPTGEKSGRRLVGDTPPKRAARIVSFAVLLALVAVFGLLSLRVMSSFLLPLLLAAMLVVIFGPLHRWLRERINGPEWVAALLTTLFVLLIVLVPLFLLVARAGGDAVAMLRSPTGLKLDPAVLDGLVERVRLILSRAAPDVTVEWLNANADVMEMSDVTAALQEVLGMKRSEPGEAPAP